MTPTPDPANPLGAVRERRRRRREDLVRPLTQALAAALLVAAVGLWQLLEARERISDNAASVETVEKQAGELERAQSRIETLISRVDKLQLAQGTSARDAVRQGCERDNFQNASLLRTVASSNNDLREAYQRDLITRRQYLRSRARSRELLTALAPVDCEAEVAKIPVS